MNEENSMRPAEDTAPTPPEEKREGYVPRPKWQIVLAWVALGIFVTGVVLYYLQIMYRY